MYPLNRLRRLRRTEEFRSLVRETYLHPSDFMAPLFVIDGKNIRREITSMPGQYHLSIDELIKECYALFEVGVKSVILFGIPSYKDSTGSEAYSDNSIVGRAIRAIKEELPEMIVVADICMCEYTDHGHCGILHNKEVDNDATLEYLCKQAIAFAHCGVDMVAPSDMMDGRIFAIRKALDKAGFENIPIMAYSAKFSSAFYGPFRDAADSTPSFGDRKSYQMDPANGKEAIREIAMDIEEGADIIMVKPALSYLDVIKEASLTFDLPLAAYNVSGEYSMIKAAAIAGWIDYERVMMESLLSIRRAGAKIIITYFAKEAAEILTRK